MKFCGDLCVVAMVLGLALMACKKDEQKEEATSEAKSEQAAAESKPAENKAAGSTGDAIGVPACDEFLQKYEKCVTEKVPEAQRETLKSSMKQWRDAWKQAAATPAGKAGLETACKQQLEASKQGMKAWGCEF